MEAIKPGGTSMVAPRKYPEELRERSIRMTLEARQDPAARSGACRRIGEQLGINPETLRGWVTQAEVDAGTRPGTTTADAARLAQLERENRELRRANAILRSASAFFAAELDRPPTDRHVHRRAQARVRSRADLRRPRRGRREDRSEHLLCRPLPPPVGQGGPGHHGHRKDQRGARAELRGVRSPQGPCPAR